MSALQPPSASKSSWWSRPKSVKDLPTLRTASLPLEKPSSHSSATSSSKSSTGSKFNTFVSSAIGKKTKKPTLTIQEPPPAISVRPSPSLGSRSGRSTVDPTPLNSPNSIQTPPSEYGTLRYYDLDQSSDFHTISEPRTPSDHPRDRSSYQHSVLTLSDPDPFASGAVVFSPFAQDLNRSSVYSDNSLLDPNPKRPDLAFNNRISYASSSSNSHSVPSDGHGARSTFSSGGRSSRRPSEASSKIPDRHRRQTSTGVESAQIAPSFSRSRNDAQPRLTDGPTDGSTSSHSTITDRNRRSTPGINGMSGIPRSNPPTVRPRGMTVGGAIRPSTASGGLGFSSISGLSSMSPGPLRRKASETFSNGRTPSDNGSPISSSPITFTRTRTSSTDTNNTTFPVSATSSTSANRPVVLVRKASSSRLLVPPLNAAPPNADLPPTPASPSSASGFMESLEDIPSELYFPEPPSSSASSLSFASQLDMSDMGGDTIHYPIGDSFIDKVMTESFPDLSPSATLKDFSVSLSPSSSSRLPPPSNMSTTPQKTLKKAISQSSLLGKRYSATSLASSVLSNEESVLPPVKAPKKQRSFHHTRIPLPPLPSLRHTSSHHSTSPPVPNDSPTSSQFSPSDQKKPTTSPTHTRKRLFSGSSLRRNSSSQQQSPTTPSSPDDDMRSVASVESSASDKRTKPLMMSFATFGNHISLVTDNACIAPAWDEPPPPRHTPVKRESTSEYVPQYIMSPEALLKLEEEFAAESAQKGHSGPQRVTSMQSYSTPKLQLEPADLGLQQSPSRRPVSARSRTNSALSGTSTASLAFGRDDPLALASHGTLQSLSPRSRATSARSESRVVSDVDSARFGFRSSSVLANPIDKPQRMRRPSTTQSSLSPPTSPKTIRHHSPERPSTALPPPPRPRPATLDQPVRERTNSNPYKRASILPINPLSPPPRRKNSQASTIRVNEPRERERERDRDRVPVLAHSQSLTHTHGHPYPPHAYVRPGQSSRPPSSFDPQKVLQRRSIMKKPSFLEIDDEMDSESGGEMEMERLVDTSLEPLAASPIMESSFLDLDRGNSFDSFRSDDDGLGVF